MAGQADAMPPLEQCPHCGAQVPPGTFCGNCGAHFTDEGGRTRLQHFAAAPNEHVARTAVISTLFPHLPQRHAHVFREALIAGVALVVVLAAVRLYAPALLAAAVLLPVLYLLYLYEVEVYEAEPLLVLGATFVAGAVLGAAYTLITGPLFASSLTGSREGVLISGVVLPLVVQLLMVAGPMLLIGHRSLDETLDGLTFGVAAALGFTMAMVISEYWHVLAAPLVGAASVSTEEIANILRAAILAALVNATTTAMITAAVWRERRSRRAGRHVHASRGLPATLLVAFGTQVLLGVVTYYLPSILLQLIVWAVAAAALLVWLRVLLHFALLDEESEVGIGAPTACPECHRMVPTMLFCPACGVSRMAAPKHARADSMRVAADVP